MTRLIYICKGGRTRPEQSFASPCCPWLPPLALAFTVILRHPWTVLLRPIPAACWFIPLCMVTKIRQKFWEQCVFATRSTKQLTFYKSKYSFYRIFLAREEVEILNTFQKSEDILYWMRNRFITAGQTWCLDCLIVTVSLREDAFHSPTCIVMLQNANPM